jgi:hypothetical protein
VVVIYLGFLLRCFPHCEASLIIIVAWPRLSVALTPQLPLLAIGPRVCHSGVLDKGRRQSLHCLHVEPSLHREEDEWVLEWCVLEGSALGVQVLIDAERGDRVGQ